MWWRAIVGALVAGGLSLGLAAAATKPAAKPIDPFRGMQPMRIVIARDSQPGCEPKCAEWISAEGDIVPETASAFHQALKRLGKRKLPIFISSPGGSIEAALAIGREIRARKLDVAIVRTEFSACVAKSPGCAKDGKPIDGAAAKPEANGAYCASSCTFVLASGTRRVAPAYARIGVHQITGFQTYVRVKRIYRVMRRIVNGRPVEISRKLVSERPVSRTTVAAEVTDRSYKPILAFFKDMGIGDGIIPLMVSAENSDIHWLTREELKATQLTTDEMPGELLLAGSVASYATNLPASAGSALADSSEIKGAAMLLVPGRSNFGIDLSVSYRKLAPFVAVRLAPMVSGQTILTTEMTGQFKVALSGGVKAANPEPLFPFSPLAAEVPVADFCILKTQPFARVGLDWTSGSHQGDHADAGLDLRNAGDLAAFVAKVCTGG